MVLTKEELSAYNKAYREKNAAYIKAYREKNADYFKLYQANNKGKIAARTKEYRKTPAGKKAQTKCQWKRRGLNIEQFEEVYQRYLDTDICDNCEIELNQCTRSTKCMDHSHETGEFRNILCTGCNTRRG